MKLESSKPGAALLELVTAQWAVIGPSFLAVAAVPLSFGAETVFPLRVGESRRQLVDAREVPFFYQADTPWMLFLKLTETEAAEYMARRKAQGFTALQVQLTGFPGMTNRAGQLPFAGNPPEQEFARPNPEFFAHVDRVIEEERRPRRGRPTQG